MKTGEEDTYQFNPIVVNSYKDMGSYFKCKLFNPDTMLEASLSSFSEKIHVICKLDFDIVVRFGDFDKSFWRYLK